MTRTVCFIQARMSSSRFPGKVLEPLGGVPMIVFMAERAMRASLVDQVVLLTSTHASDDALVEVADTASVPVFRGPLEDVLARFAEAAKVYPAEQYVRLTGDCPLIDPHVIDGVIEALSLNNADYASNIDPPTYPDGFDVECCTQGVLVRAHQEATKTAEREHVTLWMRDDANGLTRINLRALIDMSHLRLTVDYPDDLAVVRSVVERTSGERMDLFEILRCLDANRDLLAQNPHARNEGLMKSLAQTPTISGVKE